MKKFISAIISISMILSIIPCMAQGDTITELSELNAVESVADIEFKEVTEQDVEIYVTDGYEAISGAEVRLNNETKTTDENGKALFEAIPTQEELYDIVTSTDEFGRKTSSVQVAEKIEKDSEAKIEQTVSFINLNSENHLQAMSEDDDISTYSVSNTLGTLAQWVKGADISESRMRHSSVEYKGKLYVGEDSENDHFLIYDVKNDSWSTSSAIEKTTYINNFELYNKKIYNIGRSGEVSIYDIEADSWATGSKAANLEHVIQIVLHNDKIYAFDGLMYDSVAVYDIETDTWSQIASMNQTYANLSPIISYNNKLYIIGGTILTDTFSSNTTNEVCIYDIETDTWTQGASMPNDRCDATPVLMGQKIYVAGGYKIADGKAKTDLSTFEVYDIDLDTWTIEGNMPNARSGYSAIQYGDDIYYIGGMERLVGTPYKYVNKYNITRGVWETVNELLYNRAESNAIVYNGKIYVTGCSVGYTGTDKTTEIYTIEDLPDIEYSDEKDTVYNIVSAEGDDIEVKYGTLLSNIEFPDAVEAVVENSADATDRTTKMVTVKDWTPVSGYDSGLSGVEQEFEATIELDDGLENPNSVKAKVNVIVKNLEGNIVSIEPKQI
ncbi:hypothetical protein FMM68_12495, partial [Lachnospiraceae bacterium MD329]|nr:hypothetical protein [Lachnospiraceae bacterium MD329]